MPHAKCGARPRVRQSRCVSRDVVHPEDARPDGSVPPMEIDALIDAVADEFERLPGDLQGSYHA